MFLLEIALYNTPFIFFHVINTREVTFVMYENIGRYNWETDTTQTLGLPVSFVLLSSGIFCPKTLFLSLTVD